MAVAQTDEVKLDEKDRELLNELQGGFPLDPEPFKKVAEAVDLDEAEVLDRTQRLKDELFIRELGPIFDTRALGYISTLVAAKIDHDRPKQSADVVSKHPGVSHNYLRDHDFNLWFTIAVAPDSKLGIDRTLEILQEEARIEAYRTLETKKLFKINVNLEMKQGPSALSKQQKVKPRETSGKPLSDDDVSVVRYLQGDLPVVSRPYDSTAEKLGWDCPKLIDHCRTMLDRGILRRVAAILYHRRAGYSANGMGIWVVPEDRTDELGEAMASFRSVSHCYQRPTYPDWPYSIFTMVHGRDREECEGVIRSISEKTGIDDYSILYSVAEYKKARIKYFSPEFEKWEAARL